MINAYAIHTPAYTHPTTGACGGWLHHWPILAQADRPAGSQGACGGLPGPGRPGLDHGARMHHAPHLVRRALPVEPSNPATARGFSRAGKKRSVIVQTAYYPTGYN